MLPFPFLGCLLIISSTLAQEPWGTTQDLIEHQVNGSVNWSSGSLAAKGVGIPPPSSQTQSAAKAMAGRAAKAVALRNLLELVQGVRVDSTTTVKNYVLESDEIQTRIQGLVKNAREIKRNALPDGSIEVTLSMKLWGEHSLLSSFDTKRNSQQKFESPNDQQEALAYSGVILDTRGLAIQPVAFPSVLDAEKIPLLSHKKETPLKSHNMGGAQYFMLQDSLPLSSLWNKHPVVDKKEASSTLKRVGSRPLTIKGLGKAGKFQADIIVSASDAKKIRADTHLLNVLREGRVIIVTDPLIAGVEGSLPGSRTFVARVIDSLP